ncbi:MAG: 3-isopropylmalate dehydrogenase [Gammaproteobacteria bacterium]|nr:3-isopropylmalate dehydrogenase [Gammaproteobacteria bacterium]
MEALIGVLAGDGIGPEVTAEALRVLTAVGTKYGHAFTFRHGLIGGAAIDATGSAFPPATRQLCTDAAAVLLGAVGGPKWSSPDAPVRPEQGLLDMRAAMGVYANLRPVVTHPALYASSPLKPARLAGVDILVIRELTGGIYFGRKERSANAATDVCTYTREEIERVLRMAGQLAIRRRGKVTSVDKANVLDTSRLWRSVASEVYAREFPQLQVEHLLVDAAAMHLLSRAADFDVIVTENMFGDILTDEASMLTGSLGMLPSAALGSSSRGLYEPIHGSAPDIAGQGKANPCGTILSAAMLLRHSLNLEAEARLVETAVMAAIEAGARTADIALASAAPVSSRAMGDAVLRGIIGS